MGKDKPPQKEEKNFWDGCAGFGTGIWDSAKSAVTGIWDIVTSPIETTVGLCKAVIHPIDTIDNISDALGEYWDDNWTNGDVETRSKLVGRIIGEVALCILGTKGADKILKSVKVVKTAGKAKVGAKASKMTGPAKPLKKGGKGQKGKGKKRPIDKTYDRPSGYRKGVREKAWNDAKAKNPDGVVRDPVSGEPLDFNGKWDMGHKPGYEFRKHQKSAAERGISRKQFLDEHNNPGHYRPELPKSNRSHKGEDITDLYLGP